jgi:hypothetical protein
MAGHNGSNATGDRDLVGEEDLAQLEAIARSRTAPASWVERARMILLAYRSDPSTYAVGEAVGVTHQTVKRCLDRAVRLGVMAALDDSPRPGKAPEITSDAGRGWSRWPGKKAKNWDIRTSFGRRGCWRAMRASTPRPQDILAWPTSPKARSAKSLPVTTSNRTRCATTSKPSAVRW